MTTILLEPRKALNKAFLKIKPSRSHIENFKTNLIAVLDAINEKESEEFHKNLVIDFLKKTYYDPNYSVNTKGRNDLVIHNGKDAKSNVGVIIEAKSPVNKTEMITVANLNGKALQELVLYYMRERITHKNTELKHLVVTNIYEWFVFDAQLFNKLFAEKKSFVKQFTDFEEGRLSSKTTDFFYREIAKPFIETLQNEIAFAHFDIRKYDKPLRNADKEDDKSLVALFKLLSPEHLLKLSFANDSNSLDKNFYSELLHIIGLTEVKEGGKKLIERHKQGYRNSGSLLENTIEQLDSLDKISRLQNAKQYGDTNEERLFTIALELTITWVNRILFLKLLEAQLISYHKGDKSYSFLNSGLIKDYDNLNSLFFQVLARKPEERNDRVQTDFAKVPYLNSSLFEPTDLEHETLFVSGLEDNTTLPLLNATVIKDNQGKKSTGAKKALDYFFSFLDAYDFASEGSEDIQEDNKTLINASVLGLIFEKINGYKDGSFFTPSFITMYMCKETIRRAVVQKFNETKRWNCTEFDELYDKIEDRKEANTIINNLKICDPAVGSGHFLVSALNEIIAIKNDLRVLQDHSGNRLKEYQFEVVNDELIVTDEDGIPFSYNPNNKESQRIQETLFHEKQTIIENCLFGVDINPNSVKICRLRLWIELLKNAYYKTTPPDGHPSRGGELETLPNIDINIKCGNSLISRFELDADLKKALKQSKWNIESYKLAVSTYRNAESKEQKREMERLIADIKGNFRSEIGTNDPKKLKLEKLKGELFNYTQQVGLFERSKKEQTEWNKKVNVLGNDIKTLDTEIEEIKSNKIYENAFEWRFEFPDVLNDDGDFVGFDVVIGNPPYIRQEEFVDIKNHLIKTFKTHNGSADLFVYFIELGLKNLKENGNFSFIIPNKWMRSGYGKQIRNFLKTYQINEILDFGDLQVFEEATTYPCILNITKNKTREILFSANIDSLDFPEGLANYFEQNKNEINTSQLNDEGWTLSNSTDQNLLSKIREYGIPLSEYTEGNIFYGIKTGFNEAFVIDEITRNLLIEENSNSLEIIKPLFAGRDIKRFNKPSTNKFLIFSNRGIDIEKYSAIYNHLKQFETKLKAKAGGGAWYELQASPKNIDRFILPKIIYPDISLGSEFTIDYSGSFINDTAFSIPLNDIYLLGILNSKVVLFFQKKLASEIRGGYLRWKSIYVNNIPIPKKILENQQPFIDKVNEILSLKSQDPKADTLSLEQEIDAMVYELYGLSEEEIRIVEGN
jgi:type II restriction/modification system DNA methylase subunit YeeA